MSVSIELKIAEFARTVAPGSEVLDVGCGLRPYEKYFAHCRYVGIDVQASGRVEGNKKADVYYDGMNIPYPAAKFDVVLNTEVLEHCLEPEHLLREMCRVMKSGGLLFFTVPFIWGEHEVPYDFRRYSSFGIQKLFSEIGFNILSLEKLDRGIDAIRILVASEINFDSNVEASRTGRRDSLLVRTLKRIAEHCWRAQLWLWRKTYTFHRVYLDNLVVARKT